MSGDQIFMEFKTVELPWLNNQNQVSCIPVGIYEWELYESPRHGTVLLLKGVPNRTYIEVHIGNFTREIRGCILIGLSHKDIDYDDIIDVKDSGAAMRSLLALCGPSGLIEIR